MLHLFSGQFHYFGNFPGNIAVALPFMWAQTIRAVLDTVFRIGKITAALVTQCVQGTVAEQAAESVRIGAYVTGEVFAGFVLKESVVLDLIGHNALLTG